MMWNMVTFLYEQIVVAGEDCRECNEEAVQKVEHVFVHNVQPKVIGNGTQGSHVLQ